MNFRRIASFFLCYILLSASLSTPLDAVCENFVSGVVFFDANGNGIQEPTEPYISAWVRLEQNGQLYAEKLAEAEFGFVFEHVPCGQYQVFVDDRYVADIQVDDAGPSLSLTFGQPPYLFFLPVLLQV